MYPWFLLTYEKHRCKERTPLVNGFPFSDHSEALKKSQFDINDEECIPNKSFIKAREINDSFISREKIAFHQFH